MGNGSGTFAEFQLRPKLLAAKTKEEKYVIATQIIAVRAVFYVDCLRSYPVAEKEIKKIMAMVMPCSIRAMEDIIEEVEADAKKEVKETQTVQGITTI